MTAPNYALIEGYLTTAAVAREVVEAAGADIRTRAVGTGPFRLKQWKVGSRIVLEANPDYGPARFPASADPAHAALVSSMRGKSLPQIGVVDISVIEEDGTRLLEFDRGKLDYVVLRSEIANRQLVNGKVKPEYAARGIVAPRLHRTLPVLGLHQSSPIRSLAGWATSASRCAARSRSPSTSTR